MACQSATILAVKFKTLSWQHELLHGSHDILACLGVLLLRELEGKLRPAFVMCISAIKLLPCHNKTDEK